MTHARFVELAAGLSERKGDDHVIPESAWKKERNEHYAVGSSLVSCRHDTVSSTSNVGDAVYVGHSPAQARREVHAVRAAVSSNKGTGGVGSTDWAGWIDMDGSCTRCMFALARLSTRTLFYSLKLVTNSFFSARTLRYGSTYRRLLNCAKFTVVVVLVGRFCRSWRNCWTSIAISTIILCKQASPRFGTGCLALCCALTEFAYQVW